MNDDSITMIRVDARARVGHILTNVTVTFIFLGSLIGCSLAAVSALTTDGWGPVGVLSATMAAFSVLGLVDLIRDWNRP